MAGHHARTLCGVKFARSARTLIRTSGAHADAGRSCSCCQLTLSGPSTGTPSSAHDYQLTACLSLQRVRVEPFGFAKDFGAMQPFRFATALARCPAGNSVGDASWQLVPRTGSAGSQWLSGFRFPHFCFPNFRFLFFKMAPSGRSQFARFARKIMKLVFGMSAALAARGSLPLSSPFFSARP